MRRLYRRDSLVIGFALFSMFFGAGNVIFPPYLGLQSGSQWLLGFVCYYLADIGLALVAIFAMLRRGSAESITQPIGRRYHSVHRPDAGNPQNSSLHL